MAKRTLFAMLGDLPWWVSVLFAAAMFFIVEPFSRVIAGAAALPFLVAAGYAAWLGHKRGPTVNPQAMLEALREMEPEPFRAMFEGLYRDQGYEIAESAPRLVIAKSGYRTLVVWKRWRARNLNPEAVREVAAEAKSAAMDRSILIVGAPMTEPARRAAEASGVTLIDGAGLVEIARRLPAARAALKAWEQKEAEKRA